MKAIVLFVVSALASTSVCADAFVPKDAKVTLSVEYSYEAVGKKPDKYDPKEWRANRTVKITTQLTALPPTALPSMHPIEAKQTAELNRKLERGVAVEKTMAPMQADIAKMMAKCGDSESCMEAEIARYGMAMKMTPEIKSAQKDVADISKPDAPRYQRWQSSTQSGTYSIDEKYHALTADPLCESKPNKQCTRDETRIGSGSLPLPPAAKNDSKAATGYSAIEIDFVKNAMMIALPSAIMPLPYAKTVTSNHPEEKSGTTQQLLSFGRADSKPITVVIKGDLRQQSGQQVTNVKGEGAEGGTLTVRWRMSAQ